MGHTNDNIRLRDTEQIIDVLTRMCDLGEEPGQRIAYLLRNLRQLLRRQTQCRLTLFRDLHREPVPQIVRQCVLPDGEDGIVPADPDEVQEVFDESAVVVGKVLTPLLRGARSPVTLVYSEDTQDSDWFERVFLPRHLEPMGYADGLVAAWSAEDDRAITLGALRRESDPPFTQEDRDLISLMLRAAAPVIDRELFSKSEEVANLSLTERQREVLALLLAGDSEKEIARRLSRSVNTVHTHVRQLYEQLGVSSRGELMAMFIDQAVVRSELGAA